MSILDGWNTIPSLFHCSDASNITQDTPCQTTTASSDAAERFADRDDASKDSSVEASALTHIDVESHGTTRQTVSRHAESALVDGVDDLCICEDTQVFDDEERGSVTVYELREETYEENKGVEGGNAVEMKQADEVGPSPSPARVPSEDAPTPPAHTLSARQSDIVPGIMIDGTTRQLPPAQIVLVNQSSQFAAVTIPPDSDALYQPLKRNVSHGLTLESMGANVESTPQPMPAEPGTLKEQELLRQLEDAVRQKDVAARENDDLRMILHQAARRRNELVAEKDELSSQLEDFRAEWDVEVKENTQLSEDLHMLRRRNDVLEGEKEALAGRLQVISSEADTLVKEHSKLMTDLDGVSSQDNAELENRQVSQRAQDAYTQRDFAFKERDELTRRVRTITSQRDVIATQRSEIVDALSELRSRPDDTRKENGELAQQAMLAPNELFDTIEAYSDITPGGMTYQSLNSSKILRTMKRISALEREDVPRDGEFQFRKRPKALVKKWKVVWEQGEEKARRENLA